jgi:hypothetical protein
MNIVWLTLFLSTRLVLFNLEPRNPFNQLSAWVTSWHAILDPEIDAHFAGTLPQVLWPSSQMFGE